MQMKWSRREYPCEMDESKLDIKVADLEKDLDKASADFDGLHGCWLIEWETLGAKAR